MRIGYCCHDSFPSSDTNTQQIFWTLFEIARLGAAVDLVVPALDIRAGENARELVAGCYGAPSGTLPDTFQIVPLGNRPASSPLAKGWFDWRVAGRLAGGGYDLVWTRDALAAVSLLRRRLPTVFETYRPDFASAAPFRIWRRAVLRSSSLRGVITHSHVASDAFVAAGVPSAQCLVAHNGFAPSLMEPSLSAAEARTKLGLPADEFLVVYTGHVGPEKGIDALVRTAARAPGLRMVILGAEQGAPETSYIERLADETGARNLVLRPRVPIGDVASYLYAADCLIVPPTDAPLRVGRTVLPMKIFSYLAAGRPILAPRLPDVQEVLTDGVTACLVEPGDFGAAAAALVSLQGDAGRRASLARNARTAAAEYTWEARARRVLGFLGQIDRPVSADAWDQCETSRSAAAAAASSRS